MNKMNNGKENECFNICDSFVPQEFLTPGNNEKSLDQIQEAQQKQEMCCNKIDDLTVETNKSNANNNIICYNSNVYTEKERNQRKNLDGGTTFFSINKWIILVVYMYVGFASGLLHWGWSKGFREMLIRSGAYEWLCKPEDIIEANKNADLSHIDMPKCNEQRIQIDNLWTTAYVSQFFCSILGGYILDLLGPKVSAIIGILFKIIGWLLIGFSSISCQTYIPALIFIAGATDVSFLPLLTLANVFPLNKRSLVISLMGASKSSSCAVPIILYTILSSYSSGYVNLFKLCIGYIVVGLCSCLILVVLFVPYHPYKTREELGDEEKARRSDALTSGNSIDLFKNYVDINDDNTHCNSNSPKISSIKICEKVHNSKFAVVFNFFSVLRRKIINFCDFSSPDNPLKIFTSLLYILIVIYFCLSLLRNEFCIKTAPELMGEVYSVWGEIISPLRCLPCIAMGILTDYLGIYASLFILNFFGVLIYLFALIPYLPFRYLCLIMVFIYTSFVLSSVYTYLAVTQPRKHFGKLTGFASLFAGLFTLLSIGMIRAPLWIMNLILLLAGFLLAGLLLYARKLDKKRVINNS